MKNYWFLISFFILTQCSSIQMAQQEKHEIFIDTLATEKLGKKYATKENNTGSHVLVFKKYKKLKDLMASVKFFIYEKSSNNVIFQDELKAGSVTWVSDNEILAVARNLIEERENGKSPTRVYYYEVLQKKKSEKAMFK